MEEKYIAAIDLGSYKIALSVARIKGDDVQIVYYKETPSDGIKNSIITIPQRASVPLKRIIDDAEKELMIKIMQVVVSLPRYSVKQEKATGNLERTDPDDYISREEVEALKSIAIDTYPLDNGDTQIMYGAVAQSFATDDEIQLVENDVVGTLSHALEGNFKIFIGNRRYTMAIDKIFNSLGVAIAKKYFLPDVVARTVLSADDMENGVALVDFGAGVTSVAIYHGGIMRHYAAIPFGGRSITMDIRTECSISEKLAENIKLAYGACIPSKLANLSEKTIQIRYEDAPYKELSVKYLSEIIDARAREIIDAILYEIQESNLADCLRAGVVVTGGSANLVNFANLFKEKSGYNVRPGYPKALFSSAGCTGVFDTSAASAIGMVLAAKDDNLPDCVQAPEPVEEAPEVVETVSEAPEEEVFRDSLFGEGEIETVTPEKKEKAPRKIKVGRQKKDKNGNVLTIFWTKIKSAIEEEEEEV